MTQDRNEPNFVWLPTVNRAYLVSEVKVICRSPKNGWQVLALWLHADANLSNICLDFGLDSSKKYSPDHRFWRIFCFCGVLFVCSDSGIRLSQSTKVAIS